VAYPDKLLSNDEKIVDHLHPHWITLVPATLWFIVIWGAAGAGVAFAPSHGTTHSVFVIVILVVAFVLFCYLSLRPWISWRTTHYVFTDHRVLIRRGVLKRTGRDISLQRINDVGFSQSLWERMVNAGTLTIESAGEQGQETLTDMPRSDEMQQKLNRLIEEDSNRRARQAYGSANPQQGPGPGQYPPTQQYPPAQQYPPTQQYPQQ
jgi:uncharacterized membrane protein YdbT with pleckstrin-like domain